MGSLKDLIKFTEDTLESVNSIKEKVSKVQETFNANFNNVVKIREDELVYLQDSFFADASGFPDAVSLLYKKSLESQTKTFTKNLADLEKQKTDLDATLAEINSKRIGISDTLKKNNRSLDTKEEALKKKASDLQEQIDQYNSIIKEMSSGFGFISNFFSMKKIDRQKMELLEKRSGLIDMIEAVRNKWTELEDKMSEKDTEIQEKWNYLQTELAITSEKILNLSGNRDTLIRKGAFIEALNTLRGYEDFLLKNISAPKPTKCGRCSSANEKNIFFCSYCGERYAENRPDIEGSLVETGELNVIHSALMDGIKQCVSFIALTRGVSDGLKIFIKSLNEVKASEDKYPLPKLKIDIPDFSAGIAEKIKAFESGLDIKFLNLHPLELAKKTGSFTDEVLTSENIEKYFTAMGDELNKRTKEQW